VVWWIAAKWADLRKLLANSDARFRDLVAGLLDLGHDEGTVAALVAKHLPMRKLLSRTGQLMRANRMLTDDEISELCVKCEKSGADFRVVFTDKHQTPKGRWLERHVPLIAKRFGAIGKFGCDGGEATHPQWKNIAVLCRHIRNPGARLLATKRLFEARQRTKGSTREKKSRVSKKMRLAAESERAAAHVALPN
jgi:hypothetical protein